MLYCLTCLNNWLEVLTLTLSHVNSKQHFFSMSVWNVWLGLASGKKGQFCREMSLCSKTRYPLILLPNCLNLFTLYRTSSSFCKQFLSTCCYSKQTTFWHENINWKIEPEIAYKYMACKKRQVSLWAYTKKVLSIISFDLHLLVLMISQSWIAAKRM